MFKSEVIAHIKQSPWLWGLRKFEKVLLSHPNDFEGYYEPNHRINPSSDRIYEIRSFLNPKLVSQFWIEYDRLNSLFPEELEFIRNSEGIFKLLIFYKNR